MKQLWRVALIGILGLAFCTKSQTRADESDAIPVKRIGSLDWQTDYQAAYRQAKEEKKQLLIFFRDEKQPAVADSYEKRVLSATSLSVSLGNFVRVVLPLDTPAPVKDDAGQSLRLVDHSSFDQMQNRQGIAIIDLSDPKTGPYGRVTAAHPFSTGLHYSTSATSIVLELPRGTLTQRALLYALRIHPQGPRYSSNGMSPYLCGQAQYHSSIMAQVGQVGHHNWSGRSQTIFAALGTGASEVAASGHGQTILDAAISCVHGWSSSPGHWAIITSNPLLYGYDLVRAGSGTWYATGIVSPGR